MVGLIRPSRLRPIFSLSLIIFTQSSFRSSIEQSALSYLLPTDPDLAIIIHLRSFRTIFPDVKQVSIIFFFFFCKRVRSLPQITDTLSSCASSP